jgi:hypothetical protein
MFHQVDFLMNRYFLSLLALFLESRALDAAGADAASYSEFSRTGVGATGYPDLEFLWNCKRNPKMGADRCAAAMHFFCTGRCTRLNCAILTNRSICLDICGPSNPMMEPCVSAGKRNPNFVSLGQNFSGYPPGMMPPTMMPPMMGGMDPLMAAGGMLGGALAVD